MTKLIDLTGQTFERLTVLGRAPNATRGQARWVCRCACGRTKSVLSCHLLSGKILSCGCWAADKARARATHGLSNSRTYVSWRSMLNRCLLKTQPFYKHYGGRGITICPEWRAGFAAFLADMGESPAGMEIERIDNDGNYCKSNCRWATVEDQQNNRRNNVRVQYRDKTLTVSQLAKLCDVSYTTLMWRIGVAKWPVERAVHEPVRRRA